jgi:hypothetical protein
MQEDRQKTEDKLMHRLGVNDELLGDAYFVARSQRQLLHRSDHRAMGFPIGMFGVLSALVRLLDWIALCR